MGIQNFLDNVQKDRKADAKRFDESDGDLCMMCYAYGSDKRSLFVKCFYQLKEIVPEFIDLFLVEELKERGYYLRICKSCRGRFLGYLRSWAAECRELRETPKDHDGYIDDYHPAQNIPMRVDGVIVMMSEPEYRQYKESQGW